MNATGFFVCLCAKTNCNSAFFSNQLCVRICNLVFSFVAEQKKELIINSHNKKHSVKDKNKQKRVNNKSVGKPCVSFTLLTYKFLL